MDRQAFLLGVRLTLGLFGAIINGLGLSFNVYAVPIKETFNFTQTQAEIVASMNCAGFGLAFLEILLTSTFGYVATFVVTWIALPLSSVLFGFAVVQNHFIHFRPGRVHLIQLFMATSNAVTLTMMRNVTVRILPKRFVRTAIGIFGAALCFGKIVYCGFLEWICHNDLARFFFTISIVFGVFLTSFYPLLYPAAKKVERLGSTESQEDTESPKEDTNGDKKLREDSCQDTGSQEKGRLIEISEQNIPRKDMFLARFFQMTFWATVVFSSSVYAVLYNITSITTSLGIKESFNIVTTMSVCIMTSRVAYGLLFDEGASQAFAFCLLFSIYLSFALGMTLGLLFLNIVRVYIMGVLCGIVLGPANGLPVSMLVLQYGRSNLNAVYAALYFSIASSQLVLQVITGYIYDSNVVTGTICHGTHCFYWFFFSLLCLTLLIVVFQYINYVMIIDMCANR